MKISAALFLFSILLSPFAAIAQNPSHSDYNRHSDLPHTASPSPEENRAAVLKTSEELGIKVIYLNVQNFELVSYSLSIYERLKNLNNSHASYFAAKVKTSLETVPMYLEKSRGSGSRNDFFSAYGSESREINFTLVRNAEAQERDRHFLQALITDFQVSDPMFLDQEEHQGTRDVQTAMSLLYAN